MIAPLISLFARKPQLIIDHLEGYVDLAQCELTETKRRLLGRVIAAGVALVAGIAGLVLVGVSVLMNATAPLTVSLWASVLVPGVTLLVAFVAALIAAGVGAEAKQGSMVVGQFKQDVESLRAVLERDA